MAGVFTWKGIKGLRDFKSSVWRIARQRERERGRGTVRREQMELTKKAKRNDAGGKEDRKNGGEK